MNKVRRSPLIMKAPIVELSEAEIQAQVLQYLSLKGYEIKELGKARKKISCPNCKAWFFPTGWQGNSVGAPDLIISHPSWAQGEWLAIELKSAKGDFRGREEQKRLVDAGRILLARSLNDVIEILDRIEE